MQGNLFPEPIPQVQPGVTPPHDDGHGYVRESAITDWAVRTFRERYNDDVLTDTDIFYYVYGVLQTPHYGKKYAANLKRETPRIPFVKDLDMFIFTAQAGKILGDIHAYYEQVDMYPIEFEVGGWEPELDRTPEEWFYVKKMKHPLVRDDEGNAVKPQQRDRSVIEYNQYITIKNIPLDAYKYIVNGKSGIKWVMTRQCVSVDKASGIRNDANDFANETMGDPAYILKLLARVITISLMTVEIWALLDERVEFAIDESEVPMPVKQV